MTSDSPLDHQIKANLLTDTFNMVSVQRFDRKKESLNKIKYRSKGNSSMPHGGMGQKSKAYKMDTSFCGQIQIPPSGANDIMVGGFQMNPHLSQIVDRLIDEYPEEYGHLEEPLRKCAFLKFRDTMLETVQEYNRCGNFTRVFPCRNSKPYEKYFSGVFGTRMINRLTWKILFSSEVLPYERGRHIEDTEARASEKAKKDLKYDVEGLPTEQSYDQFRSKVAK